MSLPPEKIAELKQIIHSQVSQMDIQSRIKELLAETIKNDTSQTGGQLGEHELMNKLKQRGVIDDIMKQIQVEGQRDSKLGTHFISKDGTTLQPAKKANIDPTRRYLYFHIQGGRAFLEHLNDEVPLPGGKVTSYFQFHVYFRGQRFKSRQIPCACEPEVDEGFLLELHKESAGIAGRMIDTSSMLAICDPIHIVLVKTDITGDTTLVSSHFLEWRPVLTNNSNKLKVSIELNGTGNESTVPAGVLDVVLELFPRNQQIIGEDVLKTQLNLERSRQAERERLFLVYAKQWWKEFLQIRTSHNERFVKIFAQDENGNNRPACAFVKPLRVGRLLDTPRQAARFVSLIHHEKPQTLGGGDAKDLWTTSHAFLCKNKGDSEDHAVLLCSLLLGFGLNAYVCVGTKSKSSTHAWVVVINTDGLVTFWESLTAHRYIHNPVDANAAPMNKQRRKDCPYKTVGCVFNHQSFYANCQPTNSVDLCHFDLQDQSLWKSMSTDAILSVCGPGSSPAWPTLPPLCATHIDHSLVSNDLEQQLRQFVTEHRRDQGLITAWDDQLSYILTPSLAAYELERVTGQVVGNEEFEESIKQAIPQDHTFKGYPIQFTHRNGRKIFTTCLKSNVCEEIINCRGDHVRHAIRVRCFTYPESACASWVTFACQYKSVL